ncbi:hypothetical protein PUMCH_000567 [Australozyma saopauloensis]|uniref:Uncharacterized protein n=1 Tax=Australozyma saopauloensis TaxID=291208 RepID=A0AAX4H488_9ASCO|nr:hypothetical protein PUMCH_000567 [[Candida] saopauloensis]
MTRTNKWTVHEKASEPRFFTHNGHYKSDPNKVCKHGSGKFNWGKAGDEMMDEEPQNNTMGRRNSNHDANEAEIKKTMEKCDKLVTS